MPKSMQSSHLSTEARLDLPDPATCRCCQYQAYKREGPNRVVVLDEEEAIQEKTRRRAGLSDDAGNGSLMMKTQLAGRRLCADGWCSSGCAAQSLIHR